MRARGGGDAEGPRESRASRIDAPGSCGDATGSGWPGLRRWRAIAGESSSPARRNEMRRGVLGFGAAMCGGERAARDAGHARVGRHARV